MSKKEETTEHMSSWGVKRLKEIRKKAIGLFQEIDLIGSCDITNFDLSAHDTNQLGLRYHDYLEIVYFVDKMKKHLDKVERLAQSTEETLRKPYCGGTFDV